MPEKSLGLGRSPNFLPNSHLIAHDLCGSWKIKFSNPCPDSSSQTALRNGAMAEACPQCGHQGQIKAHGYLRGYDMEAEDGSHQKKIVRGLRFFVQTAIPTPAVEKRFQ